MLESGKKEGVFTVAPVASASSVCVGCVHTSLKSTHDGRVLTYELAARFDQTIASVIGRLLYIRLWSISDLSGSVYCGTLDGVSMQVNFIFIKDSLCHWQLDSRMDVSDSGYWLRSRLRRRTQDAVCDRSHFKQLTPTTTTTSRKATLTIEIVHSNRPISPIQFISAEVGVQYGFYHCLVSICWRRKCTYDVLVRARTSVVVFL